jgi:hypothetical protein
MPTKNILDMQESIVGCDGPKFGGVMKVEKEHFGRTEQRVG